MRRLIRRLREWLSDEWSFRSESGVRIIVSGNGRASVDLHDEGTRAVIAERLKELSKFDVVDGRLVKRKTEGDQ